jgi:hypothetical protein
MTYTLVQHTGIQGTSLATSIGKAFTSNVASGNLIVASGSCFGTGLTITGTSDTLLTSYGASFATLRNGSVTIAQYWGQVPSSGANTVTQSGAGSDNRSLSIMEFASDGGGTWSLDAADRQGLTATTPIVSPSVTPTDAIPVVAVGCATRDGSSGDTIAASVGWTTDEAFGTGANCILGTEHQIIASTSGSYQASFVVTSASVANAVGLGIFKTPSAPAAVPQSAAPMPFPHPPMRTA